MVLCAAGVAAAQDPAAGHEHAHAAPTEGSWQWQVGGNAFVGFNYQHRKFRDFKAWESQNWLMAAGQRVVSPESTWRVVAMTSFETFTLDAVGSPQVFQTGETFQKSPLIDYQHPHDLIMALGASWTRRLGALTATVAGDVVGSPTLGPPAFMHRPSASENPQAPLSHHYLDSTHITPGVVSGTLAAGAWRIEGSVFRGREPDEERKDIDFGALDSTAVRLTWERGRWSAQASAGWLEEPEVVTPYDARRFTASVSYTATDTRRPLAFLAAFGQNREIHGNLEAYLAEATWQVAPRQTLYGRFESVAKDILDVGFHPIGVFHRHRQSPVTAITMGYVRDLRQHRWATIGVGADVTGYVVPVNLDEAYGAPVSFHAFVRYRFTGGASLPHVH